jgi:hypothetical protein
MEWKRPAELKARAPESFAFSLLDPAGKAPADMALYMGMLGHAAFVKSDGTVFAHVHPSGTVSMAALMMAASQNPQASQGGPAGEHRGTMAGMPEMAAGSAPVAVPNGVGFPYGFPTSGTYRIFVQMKHGETIETGVFDACVP